MKECCLASSSDGIEIHREATADSSPGFNSVWTYDATHEVSEPQPSDLIGDLKHAVDAMPIDCQDNCSTGPVSSNVNCNSRTEIKRNLFMRKLGWWERMHDSS